MIYVIINPYSRVNILHPDLDQVLAKIIGSFGKVFKTKSLDHQDEVIKQAYENGVDTIGICGGDGTVSCGLTSIYKTYKEGNYPRVLFLKGGTINFLSHNVGLKSSPETTLQMYVDHLDQNIPIKTKELQTLKIEDRLGFLFVDGVGTNFLQKFYSNKTNAIGSLILFFKMLFSVLLNNKAGKQILSTPKRKLTYKDNTELKELNYSSMLFISTVRQIPFGIKFFSSIQPGNFTGAVFSFKKGILFFLTIFKNFSYRNSSQRQNFQTSILSIESLSDQKEYTYSLDGEIIIKKTESANLLEVEKGPEFNFITN